MFSTAARDRSRTTPGERLRPEMVGFGSGRPERGHTGDGRDHGRMALAIRARSLPRTGASIVPAPELKVDVNTVPPVCWSTLPHVGQTLVRQLVAARDVRPIDSLDDAGSRVRGLGPATLAQIAPYLRFEPSAVSGLESSTVATEDRPAPKPPAGRENRTSTETKIGAVQPRLVSRSSEEPGPG